MTWADFYLVCFVVGFFLSVLMFLAGGLRLHFPHFHVQSLDPADYEMVGVLGRLSWPIREGGTGELIYSQAGTRRVCGARAEDNSVILKGTEVVVTRYERGIAYVRPWSEMAGEDGEISDTAASKEARPQ